MARIVVVECCHPGMPSGGASGGNTTLLGPSNNATTFTYDDRNRLREVRVKNKLKASYRCNGLGQRVLKTDAVTPANSRQYVYDSAGHLLGEYTLAGVAVKEYVWLDDTLVAILSNFDGSTYHYVETDHLGTPRAVVHPTENTILWRWDLTPTAFGEHLPNGNPDGDSFTYTLNLRYPGQYFDAESGVHYNYFRDYEPATGRYIESDPIGLAGGSSTYGYVNSNPFRASDPSGLKPVICGKGNKVRIIVPIIPVYAKGATPDDLKKLIDVAQKGWSGNIDGWDVKLTILPYASKELKPTATEVNIHHERSDDWNWVNWYAGNNNLGVMKHEIGHHITSWDDNISTSKGRKTVMAHDYLTDDWDVYGFDVESVLRSYKNYKLPPDKCDCLK